MQAIGGEKAVKISSGTLALATGSRAAGDKLFYQSWMPDAPRTVVLLAHGYAEHLGRYDHVAERFGRDQIAVFAIDHWGHGRSDGIRGFVPDFSVFLDGLDALLSFVKGAHPDLPRILVGHSMGGLIATAHLLDHQKDYVGAVLSGPAVKPAVPPSTVTRIIGRLLSRLAPQTGILQLDSNGVSRDASVVAAYLADPLVHTGKMSARLAAEMLDAMTMVQDNAKRLTLPLLIVHGSEDSLASPAGAREMFGKLASTDKTFQDLSGLYHEVFNEPERNEVLDLVSGWIAEHLN
jgi:alpha-beta hydrolase superfamily lysophospholipase